MIINLNGKLVEKKNATISVLDRGFLYGDGVFETVRAVNGTIIELDEHIRRLYLSASLIFMKLEKTFDGQYFQSLLYNTLAANKMKNALLRLTVTRGRDEKSGNLGGSPENFTTVVLCTPFKGYSAEEYIKGKSAITVKIRRNHRTALNPNIKSCNYLNNIIAKLEARQAGADEGIMLNTDGFISEGTTSNIFWYKEEKLFTPSPGTGLLEGITRNRIIQLAINSGIKTEEVFAKESVLSDAEEIFITNTSGGVMSITSINGITVGTGKQGVISKKLLIAFRQFYNIKN